MICALYVLLKLAKEIRQKSQQGSKILRKGGVIFLFELLNRSHSFVFVFSLCNWINEWGFAEDQTLKHNCSAFEYPAWTSPKIQAETRNIGICQET